MISFFAIRSRTEKRERVLNAARNWCGWLGSPYMMPILLFGLTEGSLAIHRPNGEITGS